MKFARLLAAIVMLFAVSAVAQVPDVVLVGETACPITCPFPFYQLEWFGPTWGNRVEGTDVKMIDSAPGGRLYALLIESPRVAELFPNGTHQPLTATLTGFELHDLTVAANGAFYVLASQGTAGRILAFDPAGNLVATRDLGTTVGLYNRIDLAADQCTLFYTGPFNRIGRMNVCSGAMLPDFVQLPAGSEITDFRILPDGGVLLYAFPRGMLRFDAAGVETRTYPLVQPSAYGIALTDNGTIALFGGDQEIQGTRLGRLDLATGAVTTLAETANEGYTFSVTPRLGWTAAIAAASHGGADVPTLSQWAMGFAVALLALLALRRL